MIELLSKLEPRQELANSIIYNELQEVTELFFFLQGQFEIGFDVNGKRFYSLRYKNSVIDLNEAGLQFNAGEVIGDYGCTMNKTSRFIYKTVTKCDGFFIRKCHWTQVLKNNSFIARALTTQIVQKYHR